MMKTVLLYTVLTLNPRCGICRYLLFSITVFTVLFVWCWALKKVTAQNMNALNALINRDNATYKNYKLYIDEQDSSLYLDCVYMCGDDAFEPALMYALMSSIVDYVPEAVGELKAAFESGTH